VARRNDTWQTDTHRSCRSVHRRPAYCLLLTAYREGPAGRAAKGQRSRGAEGQRGRGAEGRGQRAEGRGQRAMMNVESSMSNAEGTRCSSSLALRRVLHSPTGDGGSLVRRRVVVIVLEESRHFDCAPFDAAPVFDLRSTPRRSRTGGTGRNAAPARPTSGGIAALLRWSRLRSAIYAEAGRADTGYRRN
jgi:hypothetical protein